MNCLLRDFVQRGEVEIKTGPFGTQLKASEYVEQGTPVLNVKNLGYSTVVKSKLDRVGPSTIERLSMHILHCGDIVFGRKGAVDRHAYISSDEEGWMQGSDCIRVRVKTPKINSRYLSYYFLTPKHQAFMISMCSHGTTMASLNQKILEQIEVPIPTREIQDKIVHLLSALDDKVELNQKINENLYTQARTLTEQWLIENSGYYEFLPLSEVALINPDSYSPKDGWEYVNYLDTSSITEGVITEIQRIFPAKEKLPSRARRIIAANDIVFSTVRPNQRHFGLVNNPLPHMLASTGFAVIRSNHPNVCNEIIYLRLTENAFIEKMQQLAEQSTSTFPSIKPSDLGECEIPCPTNNKCMNLSTHLKALFSLISANQSETHTLAALRDTLLPKLMSGEIDL